MLKKILSKIKCMSTRPKKEIHKKPEIASNVRINGRLDTVNPQLIKIGEGTIIGRGSQIITHCPVKSGPVKIGKYVFVGFGAIILPNIKIGDYALIGAGSVVTKDVEPYQIVAGNPAKRIKTRPQHSVNEHISAIKKGHHIGHIQNKLGIWMRMVDDPTIQLCINFNEDGWCDMDLFPSVSCPCSSYNDKEYIFPGRKPAQLQLTDLEMVELDIQK